MLVYRNMILWIIRIYQINNRIITDEFSFWYFIICICQNGLVLSVKKQFGEKQVANEVCPWVQ